MACTVTHLLGARGGSTKAVGPSPAGPARWNVSVWFVLANGEKHTHSITVGNTTLLNLAPVVGQVIDGLIAEHGDEVTGAGWTASTHGSRKPQRRRR